MSKHLKTVVLVSVILAVFVIACFASAPYFVKDSLVSTEFYPVEGIEGCYVLNLVTESGVELTGSLTAEKTALSESYYFYTFSFNDNTSSDAYSIGSFGLALDLPEGFSVTDACEAELFRGREGALLRDSFRRN